MKLGLERLLLLKAIDKLSKNSIANAVKVIDITNELKKKRNVVAKALSDAKRDELVENPIRGCWRLTKKGKRIVDKYIGN